MAPKPEATPPANSATMRAFVHWIRAAAPYVHAFRGRTFVIAFGGEVVAEDAFLNVIHDLNLLHSLGIHLVVVHGCRPQVEVILEQQGFESRYAGGVRVTDADAMDCVLEAAGQVRARIEALLSLGLANSPMAGSRNRVSSGNYITAKPLGVVDGVDMQHTGEVRRVDTEAIQQRLDDGDIVLISPIGYSPTGEIFNLTVEEVATQVAVRLSATKLVFLVDADGVRNGRRQLLTDLSTREAEELLARKGERLAADVRTYLPAAVRACNNGVARSHLISRRLDGALLLELFTRDGVGTMVAAQALAHFRSATIDDVGGILAIIEPLEEQGVLVRRSRERLEAEIERFVVAEYDNHIIGCAALYAFPDERVGELAALAVHPDFRREGYGEALAREIDARARKLKLAKLFVLTTRTAHWFVERGFRPGGLADLPQQKQALYNWQRKSQVYVKSL
ncbi:MAG: amino-acid N-acetyltransferase [Betaproteobacteria bacterium]|nr:amino-acid N-acetyltransferase [Betaproteobacteria bacterium]MDH5287025.1 amino-acid N-acetyltransferase [Betaproteobacteria bacterium]